MNIIRLKESSHYQIGYTHGSILGKEIKEMADYLPEFLQKTRGKLLGRIAYKFLLKKAKKIKRFIPPEYMREMLGVADGAGVNPDFILLINVFDELKNIYGCSALAIEGKYGATIDYAVFGDFLGPRNTVFVYQHKKPKHSFVSIGWPGYVGLIRGMNDRGMVLISLASYSKDQTIKGIPTSFLYREIIESNDHSLIERAPRTIGNNILIGDKEKVKIIEVSAHDWGVRKPWRTKGKKYITVTNNYETVMNKHQRPPKPVKGSTIPKNKEREWFWNFFGLEGSKKRRATLEKEIQKSKEFTPEIIKNILAQVANLYCTLAAMIFDPANLTLYIADNEGKMPATDGKLVKINLKDDLK